MPHPRGVRLDSHTICKPSSNRNRALICDVKADGAAAATGH